MSNEEPQRQYFNNTPPLKGNVLALTLDTSGRIYDMSPLDFGVYGAAAPFLAQGKTSSHFVTLISDVDFFVSFSADGVTTPNDATTVAAGGALAFNAAMVMLVPAKTYFRTRISRVNHRYMHVKGSGAGTLRFYISSQTSAGAA